MELPVSAWTEITMPSSGMAASLMTEQQVVTELSPS